MPIHEFDDPRLAELLPPVPAPDALPQLAQLLMDGEARKCELARLKIVVENLKEVTRNETEEWRRAFDALVQQRNQFREDHRHAHNQLAVVSGCLKRLVEAVALVGEGSIPDRFAPMMQQRRAEALELLELLKQKNLI